MLLDPETYELAPRANEVLALLGGDDRFKLELPASQLEILTPPSNYCGELGEFLLDARRDLVAATAGSVLPASAGVHPVSPGVGQLNRLPQYEQTISEYASIAPRQLVCALQVHVAVGSADAALDVYNAARSYLPLLAALAANAPFYEGRDTGLASVRPKLCELLPRQGIPPVISSWEQYADVLAWGARSGTFPTPRTWWWELRPHVRFGTLEFRVPDGQSSVADAVAIAAVVHALVAWLLERQSAGELAGPAPDWQLQENRFSASRHGVRGTMADPDSGGRRSTGEWLQELLEQIAPQAAPLRCEPALAHARALARRNGAIVQREIAAKSGPAGVARALAERFASAEGFMRAAVG